MAQYNEVILAYIDLLGFRSLVGGEQGPERILKLLNVFETVGKDRRISFNFGRGKVRFFAFSDLIVRVNLQRKDKLLTQQLWEEALNLARIQRVVLLSQGILTRGALTVGDICIKKGIIFGPALNRAYELESILAKHPRIVIDPELVRFCRERYRVDDAWFHRGSTGYPWYKMFSHLLRTDSDDVTFIDYLAHEKLGTLDSDGIRRLEEHKELILNGLRRFSSDPRKGAKWEWVRQYHDDTIDAMDEGRLTVLGSSKVKLAVGVIQGP